MGSHTAFFYGTLMAREILNRVIYGDAQVKDPAKAAQASLLTIRPAILHGYCRHRVQSADYPGIIPSPSHSVRGTYVTGLTTENMFYLDMFEGSDYTRLPVSIKLLNADGTETSQNPNSASEGAEEVTITAEAYIYTAPEDTLEKKEWDYEEFRKEKMHRWTGESAEFKEVDEYDQEGADSDSQSEYDVSGGRGFVSVSKEVDGEEEEVEKFDEGEGEGEGELEVAELDAAV